MNRNEYLAGHRVRRAKIIALLRNQSVKSVAEALGISTQRVYTISNGSKRKRKSSAK